MSENLSPEELENLSFEETAELVEERLGIKVVPNEFYLTEDGEEGEGDPVPFNPALIVAGRNRNALLQLIAATPAVAERKKIETRLVIQDEEGEEVFESIAFIFEGTVDEYKEKLSDFNHARPLSLIHYAQRLSQARFLRASVALTAQDAAEALDILEQLSLVFEVPGFNVLMSQTLGEHEYREFIQLNDEFTEPSFKDEPEAPGEAQTWVENTPSVKQEVQGRSAGKSSQRTWEEITINEGVEDTHELYARYHENDPLDDSLVDDELFIPIGGEIPEEFISEQETENGE